MKRRLEITPRARRDLAAILSWYRENLGARAALKVAKNIDGKLRSIGAGRIRGAAIGQSAYLRVLARKHALVIRESADATFVVRIVHGAQDLEAIAAELDG